MSAKSLVRLSAVLAALVLTPLQFALAQPAPAKGPPPGSPNYGPLDTRAIPPFRPPPAGVKPLPIDMFTSKNFYKDKALWSDPRYYRCNSPREIIESLWETGRIGAKPPTTASWGDSCKDAFPRDKIVSPYPYKTAKEHYEALLAAARARGGPTVYTKATTPDWDGFYARDARDSDTPGFFGPDWRERGGGFPGLAAERWQWGGIDQASTIVSLLTPEYQKRYVQMLYHEGVDNSKQWNAQFCYPEGFIRWWAWPSQGDRFQLTMTPYQVQFLSGVAGNFLRQVLIGQTHVQKVPQWYGETVGFWDGDTLIAWTANAQGWNQHTMFETSDKMESVEIFKPVHDAAGNYTGLEEEAVFYDPDALAQPVRYRDHFDKIAAPNDPKTRYTFIECLSNIRNVNGHPKQLTKSDPDYIDFYGRPWAQVWEKYFEAGWDKPAENVIPDDVLNSLK